MRVGTRLLGGVVLAASIVGVGVGSSVAAFPNFAGCPLVADQPGTCINIQSTAGSIDIKGFGVNLAAARLEIRGGISFEPDGSTRFVPARGTNGFFANPVDVPGGVIGVDLPISLNRVTAQAQLAGSPSDIGINLATFTLSLPIKLKLSNPLFASTCTIGTNSRPVRLNLITGTTAPPAPNRPISGRRGTPDYQPTYTAYLGGRNVDNSFAIPGASGCGWLNLGLIDSIINAKLRLPSAAGNNTMIVDNNVAIKAPE